MALFRASIPFSTDATCTSSVQVEYKKDFETAYRTLSTPVTISPAVIDNLDGGSTYNIRLTRRCCNGQPSGISSINIKTP